MSKLIQPLESRLLMTAATATLVADSAAVTAASSNTRAELVVFRASESSLLKLVASEVKLTQTKAQRAPNGRLASLLVRTDNAWYGRVAGAENSLIANAKVRAAAGVSHGRLLNLHPTKIAYQNAVAKDINLLNTIIPTKLGVLEADVTAALSAIDAVYSSIEFEDPQVTDIITTGEATAATDASAFTTAAGTISAATSQLATDLSTPVVSASTLTGAVLFRGDPTGANLDTQGSVVTRGAWTSGLDVQNVPGNYAAEFFISKIPNPTTTADYLSPGALASALTVGVNTFYFFADSDDTAGGSNTFGLNLYLDGSTSAAPAISGYTVPGTGQTLAADSAATTSSTGLVVTPGAGTLSSGSVTLSSFVVEGVGGSTSTVDLVDSTNTAPFSFPVVPDGITDTYGTFTLTVTG